MSAAEHLQEAIDVGCTRDDHDHVADHRAEVLAEAAAVLTARAVELSAMAEEEMRRDLEETAQEWHQAAEVVAKLAPSAAGKDTAGEPTRPPAGAEVRFTDRYGDEWVSCSDLHCTNSERYAKATERGWQHGHTGTWRCPRHRTSPTYASTRGEPGGAS